MTSTGPGWFFEAVSPMGGANIGTFRNTLAGQGIPEADLFAREAIQNAVDAARADREAVHVAFKARRAEGAELEELRQLLVLTDDSDPLRRSGLLAPESIAHLLRRGVELLYVEDFHTTGLGGTVTNADISEEDNYRRLCLTVGETREGAEGLGGTFGFGKTVYWNSSSLWTVVVYSRFEPTPRTEGATSRLMAVSWFNQHEHETAPGRTSRFTGRAWLGTVPSGGGLCVPLVDQAADKLATRLGFSHRAASDTGTSFLILGHRLKLNLLKVGVERYWWPRLLDGRLTVELAGGETPKPRERPDLYRYVRSWDLLTNRLQPTDDDEARDLSYKKRKLGRFVITAAEPQGILSLEESEAEDDARVKIALVRKPGMVVDYLEGPPIGAGQPLCRAAFKADDGLDQMLAASEPPQHNQWDWRTIRRDRLLTEQERSFIKAIYEKAKSAAREFLKSRQEPPPQPPARCRELEKLLGRFLPSGPEGPTPPPPRPRDPFKIHFLEPVTRREVPEGVVLDARVSVALTDEALVAQMPVCRATAWIDTIVDRGGRAPRSERVAMAFMSAIDPRDHEERLGESDGAGATRIEFFGGTEACTIDFRSEPLPHPEYRAELQLVLEVLG